MSGGFLKPQKSGDHQVVMFTFAGEIAGPDAAEWNRAILDLKQRFGTNLVSVTLKGDPTPPKFRKRGRGG